MVGIFRTKVKKILPSVPLVIMVSVVKKLGKKCQVNIPKIFADHLGVSPYDIVNIDLIEDGIIIKKATDLEKVLKRIDERRITNVDSNTLAISMGDLKGASLEDEFDE